MDGETHRLSAIIKILQEGGRWLLLALLIFAPWAYGATQPRVITWVAVGMDMCAVMTLGPVMAQAFASRHASLGGVLWFPAMLAAVIVLTGWSAAWNAQSYYDPYLQQFVTALRWLHFWPSSVDAEATNTAMERLSALLLTVLVSSHAVQSQTWRRRLLMTMAFTGVSIALFGIAQKLAEAPLLFWNSGNFGETVFATYRYHANAGAYLNLIWPICGALAMEAFERRETNAPWMMWSTGAVIVLAGLALNISKGAHVVTVCLMMASAFFALARLARMKGPRRLRRTLAGVFAVGAFIAVVMAIGWNPVMDRWTSFFHKEPGHEGRIWMARACLDMIGERPWRGFGPGTFSLVFPFYSKPYGELFGVWRYAHCDYLQMLVEWGILGSLLWAILIAGGILHLFRRILVRQPDRARIRLERSGLSDETPVEKIERRDAFGEISGGGQASRALDLGVLLSLAGVLLHAAFDFPLQIASIQLYFAVLLGVAWRRKQRRKNRRGKEEDEVQLRAQGRSGET